MIYQGVPGSEGIAIGEVYLYKQGEIEIDQGCISSERIEWEIEKLHKGFVLTNEQLLCVKQQALDRLGEEEARIFDAHIALLRDPAFIEEISSLINVEQITAAFAVQTVVEQYVALFVTLEDEYMRERAGDIRDVGDRLLRNVLGLAPKGLEHLTKEVIIVASDLTPSDTLCLSRSLVKGLVLDKGGKTSHAAIIARTLEIPAVLGLGDISEKVQAGESVILDGSSGVIITQPSIYQFAEYQKKQSEYLSNLAELQASVALPAVTRDGRKVEITANIGRPQDCEAVISNGGAGVGLYRTEFLYMERDRLPDEEEQFAAYKEVAQHLAGKPVIIRTLDIGGDKELKALDLPRELNPFLGWRAIRICLARKDIFKTQLRAILRASAYGKVLIMYPMISGVSEVREANSVLTEAKRELRRDGISFDENIKVGIMVEIPSAAITADVIIKEVDFFSIGTNDLCQYTLAVDRMNEKISHLYQPLHPAVLRLIKNVIDVSHRYGKFTGMCGELAGDPMAAATLLGLGLDEFSMSASSMLCIKKIIRSLSYQEAQEVANMVLAMETPEEIIAYSRRLLGKMPGYV